MEEIQKYIYAFDLSLSNTGLTIFDNDANIVYTGSIDTKSEKEHQKKLKVIAENLLEIKEKYVPNIIIFERGFSRFNASTQAIFKTVGLVQYLFNDYEQIFYPAATVKKVISGQGNAKKEEIYRIIKNRYKNIEFGDLDQSDACSVGLCYFIKEKGLKI